MILSFLLDSPASTQEEDEDDGGDWRYFPRFGGNQGSCCTDLGTRYKLDNDTFNWFQQCDNLCWQRDLTYASSRWIYLARVGRRSRESTRDRKKHDTG